MSNQVKQNSATTIYNVIPIIKNVASQKQDPNFISPNAAKLWRQTSKTTKEAVNNSHNLQERYYEKLLQKFTEPVGDVKSTRKQLFSIKQYIDMMSPALCERALAEFMMLLFKNRFAMNMLWVLVLDYLVMKTKDGSLNCQDMLNKCFISFNDLKANTNRIEAFNADMREMASHSVKIAVAISYLIKEELITQDDIIKAVAQLGIDWDTLRSCDWQASNLYIMNFNGYNLNSGINLANNPNADFDTYECDNYLDQEIIIQYFKECKRNPKRFLKMYCEVVKHAVTNPTRYISSVTDDEVETVRKFPITSAALQSLRFTEQTICRSVRDIIKQFFDNPPNINEDAYIGDLNSLVFNQKVVKIIYAYTFSNTYFVRFVCPVVKKPNANMFCLVELSLDYIGTETVGILKLFETYEEAKAECTNVVSGLEATVYADTSKDTKFAWDLQKAGGSTRMKYQGRSYAIKTGPRGGKYLVVKGKKVYL